MGKHGAGELNYASDVDVIFVSPAGENETAAAIAVARRVLGIAGRAFRVDTDLRPEGRNGALARSLDSYVNYWQRWARPWEFQALLKARFAAGDAEIGSAFEERSAATVWGRRLGAEDLAELRSMKGRAEQIVSRRGLTDREIKRGRGGIRDIEFSVQLLQLVHGGADPLIRRPATLAALAELGGGRLHRRRRRLQPRPCLPLPAHGRAPPAARGGGAGAHGAGRPGGPGGPCPRARARPALRRRPRPLPVVGAGHPRAALLPAAPRGLRRQARQPARPRLTAA